ncbi:Hypothetical protein POVR2_LOCUS309, partial [uncultured virus]
VLDDDLEQVDTLDLPTADIASLAHSGGELYAASKSQIYVLSNNQWSLIGSVEESIEELHAKDDSLRVVTDSAHYILKVAGGSGKMSQCNKKATTYQGERLVLADGTLRHGSRKVAKNVDCYAVRDSSLLYTDSERIYLRSSTGKKSVRSKKIDYRAYAACLGDDGQVYVLSS